MFAITGSGSVFSLLLLIFIFDDSRFEPDWVSIFDKHLKVNPMQRKTQPKQKVSRSKLIEVDYFNLVSIARMSSGENGKSNLIKKIP